MSKHTPGPWKFSKCRCGMDGCRSHTISVQGSVGFDEADARLIAAAPDLLEACKLIVSAFDALKPASAARNEPLQINAARAAIAKAEGKA